MNQQEQRHELNDDNLLRVNKKMNSRKRKRKQTLKNNESFNKTMRIAESMCETRENIISNIEHEKPIENTYDKQMKNDEKYENG